MRGSGSRAALALAFVLAMFVPALAHGQAADDPPPSPPPSPTPEPAPAPDPAPPDEAAPAPGPEAEPAPAGPTEDDADADADDDDHATSKKKKKKKKSSLHYEPGRGITIRDGKTRLRFFMGAETVLLYGHCSADNCEASDLMTIHVRRARFAAQAKLPHHLTIDFAIQVKNEVLVLKNANFSIKTHGLTLKAGFQKPPGGLERDTSTWIKPFPERSVVANFKQDRIIGLTATKWLADHTLRLQASGGRPPAGNFDAFEPEDVVVPPSSIEPEDLTTDPGNWDVFATAAYVPDDHLEIGLNTTAHISPDAGKGPNFSEPYETRILQPRFIKGAFLGGGADVSWHGAHVRASAELVAFRSGETIPHTDMAGNALEPTRAERGYAGYAVLGITPNGEYGPAAENSPLRRGWQWLLRGEYLEASPGGTDDPYAHARFGSVTTGIEWQVHRQLRTQFDVAVQKYNGAVDPSNKDAVRVYAELWAQVLM